MRYHTAWSSFLFLLFCFEVATSAASAQKVRLYVDNSEGDDVSVIDLKTLNTLGDIHLADKVHGLAIEADGRKLFATVESDNTLRVVDTATNNMIATIKLTGRPNQCAVTPDGHYVAVPIRDKGAVDIVDVIAPVPASDFPVPANVAKAWCDTQHDGDSAFNQILAPFTEIPVKRSLTESFLDDFAKAARVALEKTLTMRAVSFVEQAKTLHLPTFAGGRQLRSATSP